MSDIIKRITEQMEAVRRERDEYSANILKCTGAIIAFELVLRELKADEKGEDVSPPIPQQEIPSASDK